MAKLAKWIESATKAGTKKLKAASIGGAKLYASAVSRYAGFIKKHGPEVMVAFIGLVSSWKVWAFGLKAWADIEALVIEGEAIMAIIVAGTAAMFISVAVVGTVIVAYWVWTKRNKDEDWVLAS